MHQVNQRKTRQFQDIDSVDEMISILKSQFADRKLYIKNYYAKTEININEYLDDNTLMVVTDPNYEPEDTMTIYGLSDKYIEVDFEIVEVRAPGYYQCAIKNGRRAVQGRRHLRFRVEPDQVHATNFKVSKHSIELSGFSIPTSIKVVLEQFQSHNQDMSDIFKVNVFSSNPGPIMGTIKKTGKSLLIHDISDKEAYRAINEDFLDLHKVLEDELDEYIKKNIEKGYKSQIIVPIIYITEAEDSIPFGYIQLISKSEHFNIEMILEIKKHTFKLVDRIRDANTLLIPVHQEIIDISRGGAKLSITDENLKKSILKSRGFIFDIVFKLQAPITIYGEVKCSYTDQDSNLIVGVDFEGNSSRKDEMKRFYAILKPMEADYKSRLIKTMRKKS